MASAHILQYYNNTRTKTAAASTTTQTFSTTPAVAQHCFVRHTSGTSEACLFANERKQFTDKPSATTTTTAKATETTTTSTSTKASTEISTLLSAVAAAEYAWVQSKSTTKRQFTETTKGVQQSRCDQKLQELQLQAPPQFQTLQTCEREYRFLSSPSVWKQASATKRPSSSQPKPTLPRIQKTYKEEDDVQTFPFVESRRRGRSKSECPRYCSVLDGERYMRKQQQQRSHSENRERVWCFSEKKIKCIAKMSSAAASSAELQEQQQMQQQQAFNATDGTVVSASAGPNKIFTGNGEQHGLQARNSTHITQTQKHNNKNNKDNTTKSCQPEETKQKGKHDVAACCQAASGRGCCFNPSDVASCSRQSSKNANEQQQQQLQHFNKSNDFKLQFPQPFTGSRCTFALNISSPLPQQQAQAPTATTTALLLLQPASTANATATIKQRNIFQYKNCNGNCNCNRCFGCGRCNGSAATVTSFDNGCVAPTNIPTRSNRLAALYCSVRSTLLATATDLQIFARALFSLIIIFNMLPLFYAGE
ncbi:uncharacterized protein LOC129236803 [Anastrepha obliqua]|uniref:uncharacterized protein LOC129236803 n=1 Tax=Anastrepha obliqua TaxID=95512 RepID=UPI00240915EF|nr:uncharacterized protein LOC129236803 [Anastrepha obliqua]